MSDYHKRWREERKAKGLCLFCNNKSGPRSKVFCEECRKKQNEKQKRRQKAGMCRCCDKKVGPTSIVFCEGCLKKSRKYHRSLGNKTAKRFAGIKHRAKTNKIDFLLTLQEFCEWFDNTEKVCCYCGVSEEHLNKLGRKKSMLTVDRKNNTRGYEQNNICLACFRCNNMKSNFFTEAEWKEIADKYIKPRLEEYHRP